MTFEAQSRISTLVWSEALVVYKKKTRTSERMFKASSFLYLVFLPCHQDFFRLSLLTCQCKSFSRFWLGNTKQVEKGDAWQLRLSLSSGLTCLVTLLNNTDFFFSPPEKFLLFKDSHCLVSEDGCLVACDNEVSTHWEKICCVVDKTGVTESQGISQSVTSFSSRWAEAALALFWYRHFNKLHAK